MPKVKIPRKSTVIDMTAMCDVAFLLLSFFILATKQKPPEAVSVMAPSSVSNKVAKEEAILVTLTKDGKIFLLLGGRNEAKQRTGLGCARTVHDGLYGNDQDPGCNSWSELLRHIDRSWRRH